MILSLVTLAALLVQDAREAPPRLDLTTRIAAPTAHKALERGPQDGLVVYGISDLTGQHRLDALARDITSGNLSEETRIAALDRYVELLESGDVAGRAEDMRGTIEELIQPPLSG